MLTTTDREALRETLVGVTCHRTAALILMSSIPDEELPEIIKVMRRMIGFDRAEIQ